MSIVSIVRFLGLLSFFSFSWMLAQEIEIMRGFVLQKRNPPPLTASDHISAGASAKGTVWIKTTYTAPRKTIIWLQSPSGAINKLTELDYAVPYLDVGAVGERFVAVKTIDDNDSIDKVWWIDLATGNAEIVVGYKKLITATYTPTGLPNPITQQVTVSRWSPLIPDGYTELNIEPSSRSAYGGIFQYFGGTTFKQIVPRNPIAPLPLTSWWVFGPIWLARNRNKIYYNEVINPLVSPARIVEHDLSKNATRILLDSTNVLGEQAEWWRIYLDIYPDEERSNFFVSYQTTPFKLPWYENAKNKILLLSPEDSPPKIIYSTDQAIGEFGGPWDARVMAVGKFFAVVGHHIKPPVYNPADFLSIFDGQKVRPFLRVGDILGGRKIKKLGPVAAYGCQAEILTFGENDEPSLWRLRMPCILSVPQAAAANAGQTLTLTGQNFTVGNPTLVVLVDNAAVPALSVTDDQITFLIPRTAEGKTLIAVRLTYPSGSVTTNSLPIQVAGVPSPVFSARGVVNGASFQEGISPCSLATIFGQNLAAGEAKAEKLPLPTELAGTRVTFDGHAAGLWYVSPGQVNLQVPCELGAPARVRVQVMREGIASSEVHVDLTDISPGLFKTGELTIFTDEQYRLVSKDNPAQAGKVYTAWATGLGITNPPALTAVPAQPSALAWTINPVRMVIGGQEAEVLFAGLAPGLVGVYQVNFILPNTTTRGVVEGSLVVGVVGDKQERFQIVVQ